MSIESTLQFTHNLHLLAEIGVNHGGDLSTAKKLIALAKESGCNSVKLQAYKAESLVIEAAKAYWDLNEESTERQIDLFRKYDSFEIEDYKELYRFSQDLGIQFGLSIFDADWVAPLARFVDYFKIASADITCAPLLEEVSKYQKPVILSTGASTLQEIKTAVSLLEKNGTQNISLLHCILNYPSRLQESNLSFISCLKKEFPKYRIGLSDHVAEREFNRFIVARSLGVTIIEKHFTHDRGLPGNDHYHSGTSEDFRDILKIIFQTDEILGSGTEIQDCEIAARSGARRSIVYSKNLTEGEVITKECLGYKRPGTGISPMHYRKLVGKRLKKSVVQDEFVELLDFE